jgi:uncharacterized protein with beta-barrel porin domain
LNRTSEGKRGSSVCGLIEAENAWLAWAHDFDPDRSIAATFQTLPGASFVANSAAQASGAALTTASAEIK